ncbi:MAG: universal stress protein [Myxococcota bacterium]|nr:universal stress protein [Myxococcota bacterium]
MREDRFAHRALSVAVDHVIPNFIQRDGYGSEMPKLDQFESVFRAAAKQVYTEPECDILRVCIVVDDADVDPSPFTVSVKTYLAGLPTFDQIRWDIFDAADSSLSALLLFIQDEKPDMVCTYRQLCARQQDWVPGLGDYVEMLTQVTEVPVLLFPNPQTAGYRTQPKTIMAVTDHMSGEHRLVTFAAKMTPEKARLLLAHVEDDAIFEKYLVIIGKIADIDTETARRTIRERLMKEAREYMSSCAEALRRAGLEIETRAMWGHHVSVYQELVRRDEIDLLVMNTKDDDQLAMHGLAYPLAVEFTQIPVLLL